MFEVLSANRLISTVCPNRPCGPVFPSDLAYHVGKGDNASTSGGHGSSSVGLLRWMHSEEPVP
jgi:hypothetical protein